MSNYKLNQTGAQIQADLNLLDSNTATQGQVLKANGTGGAEWGDASGGLYRHFVYLENDDTDHAKAVISVITSSNSPFTASSFKTYIDNIMDTYITLMDNSSLYISFEGQVYNNTLENEYIRSISLGGDWICIHGESIDTYFVHTDFVSDTILTL